jgi:alkylhydroperoxidase/carboxymuconolactone decarboxylase family protein YurZ
MVLSPRLLAIAATQRGVFTSEQAYAQGHTQKEIQRLREKHLFSIRRGVYVWFDDYKSATPLEQHRMRVAALTLVLTAPGVLSHQTAAAELDLDLLDAELAQLHVTRPSGAGSRIEAGVVHHAGELPDHHVLSRGEGELPTTTRARTAVDVGLTTDRFECMLAALDSAMRAGATREELREVFDLCRGWPGARMLSGALSLADGRADNPGESWSRAILIGAGLAPEDIQTAMHDADGLIGYTDFRWKGVVGEFDGKLKYKLADGSNPEQMAQILWKEKRREDRLRVDNEIARWGVAELQRPSRLIELVEQAMLRARRRGLC